MLVAPIVFPPRRGRLFEALVRPVRLRRALDIIWEGHRALSVLRNSDWKLRKAGCTYFRVTPVLCHMFVVAARAPLPTADNPNALAHVPL